MTVDLIGTGGFPRGLHRMRDARVRLRVMFAAAVLLGASWGAIALLARPACTAFTQSETRDLASLPVTPACIQGRVAPANPLDNLNNLQNPSSDLFPGASP